MAHHSQPTMPMPIQTPSELKCALQGKIAALAQIAAKPFPASPRPSQAPARKTILLAAVDHDMPASQDEALLEKLACQLTEIISEVHQIILYPDDRTTPHHCAAADRAARAALNTIEAKLKQL
jgi:hypothetical protein